MGFSKKNYCIVGVMAGKGGVGKSTITAGLARGLEKKGVRVGVFDADIYGPSIQSLLPEDQGPQADERGGLNPARSGNISIMSAAYLPKNSNLSIVRAPIAIQMISRFIEEVEWGDFDVLLVDFPPGTGDIQITLMQKLFFNGAVMITTPQKLALLDVRKSMQMCIQMGVPILGVVENMSYFISPDNREKYFVFGEGGGKLLSEEFSVPLLAEIPIDSLVSQENVQISHFDTLAEKIIASFEEEKRIQIKEENRYHFSIKWIDGKKSFYRFDEVQSYCPCVKCKGNKEILKGVMGEKIVRVGNYGMQILFSKGCSKGIYPFTLLRGLGR